MGLKRHITMASLTNPIEKIKRMLLPCCGYFALGSELISAKGISYTTVLYQTVLVLFWDSLHYAPLTPGGFYCSFFFSVHLSCRAQNIIWECSVGLSSAKKSS